MKIFISFLILFILSSYLCYGEEKIKNTLEINLQKCIDISIDNDLTLKDAREDVKIAEAQLKRAISGLYPLFSASGTYGRRDPAPVISLAPGQSVKILEENQYDLTFRLKYLIYDGGGVYSLKLQSEAKLEAVRLTEEKIEQDVIYRASIAYFNAVKSRHIARVAEESTRLSQEQLDISRKRYSEGTIAKADVLKADAQLAEDEVNLVRARNFYDVSMANLKDTMGIPLDSSLEIEENYMYEEWHITIDDSLKSAMDNRLEREIMEKIKESSAYAIEFARSSWYPDLFFSLDYTPYGNSLLTKDNTLVATLGMQVSIFDGFKTSADVEEAEARFEKSSIQSEDVDKKIKLDVTKSFLDFQSACEKVVKTEKNLAASKESYRVAQISYKEGITPYIDVNQAQVVLINSEVRQIQAIFDYYVAKVELIRAMGLLGKTSIDNIQSIH